MKIDVTRTFTTLNGKEIKNEEGEIVTLRSIIANSLLAQYQDETNLSGEEKVKRWKLAQTVYADDIVNLSTEDIVLIKKLVGKSMVTLIAAQAWEMLESPVLKLAAEPTESNQ